MDDIWEYDCDELQMMEHHLQVRSQRIRNVAIMAGAIKVKDHYMQKGFEAGLKFGLLSKVNRSKLKGALTAMILLKCSDEALLRQIQDYVSSATDEQVEKMLALQEVEGLTLHNQFVQIAKAKKLSL